MRFLTQKDSSVGRHENVATDVKRDDSSCDRRGYFDRHLEAPLTNHAEQAHAVERNLATSQSSHHRNVVNVEAATTENDTTKPLTFASLSSGSSVQQANDLNHESEDATFAAGCPGLSMLTAPLTLRTPQSLMKPNTQSLQSPSCNADTYSGHRQPSVRQDIVIEDAQRAVGPYAYHAPFVTDAAQLTPIVEQTPLHLDTHDEHHSMGHVNVREVQARQGGLDAHRFIADRPPEVMVDPIASAWYDGTHRYGQHDIDHGTEVWDPTHVSSRDVLGWHDIPTKQSRSIAPESSGFAPSLSDIDSDMYDMRSTSHSDDMYAHNRQTICDAAHQWAHEAIESDLQGFWKPYSLY